jgi:P-type E1-E2 ATPase
VGAFQWIMIEIEIPGFGLLRLKFCVLDMNGTIATEGIIEPALRPYFEKLSQNIEFTILTADTFGTVEQNAAEFGLKCKVLSKTRPEDKEKEAFVKELGKDRVVAIGNGNNDWRMLKAAALGIGVMGNEGISSRCLAAADIVVKRPEDAFNMLLDLVRIRATLRS